MVKSTKRPVPIICTSGTAVANYHPAVLEAHHTNQPLLVLTADRPAMLRRTGANQTTEQARIFGKAVRYFADVDGPVFPMELPLDSLRQGPVHLNIQFDEPLLPDTDNSWLDEIKIAPKDFINRKGPGKIRINETRGALVIGHDRGGLALMKFKSLLKIRLASYCRRSTFISHCDSTCIFIFNFYKNSSISDSSSSSNHWPYNTFSLY